MYDDGLKEPWRENYCNSHWGFESQQSVDDCIRRAYLGMRVFFWVIGLIGACAPSFFTRETCITGRLSCSCSWPILDTFTCAAVTSFGGQLNDKNFPCQLKSHWRMPEFHFLDKEAC